MIGVNVTLTGVITPITSMQGSEAGMQAYGHVGRLAGSQPNRQTDRQVDGNDRDTAEQKVRQKGQTDGQGSQTDRQIVNQTASQ